MSPITITIQKEVPYIIGIVTLFCIACVIIGIKIKKTDPLEKPNGYRELWRLIWILILQVVITM